MGVGAFPNNFLELGVAINGGSSAWFAKREEDDGKPLQSFQMSDRGNVQYM